MILGIGVDLCAVARISSMVERHGERARRRLFTARERADCDCQASPPECLAARFAAKEAAFKALGTGLGPGMRWIDVEVITEESGRPRIEFSGITGGRMQELGVRRAHLSLTHEAGQACAMVVLEGAGP